MDNNRDFNNEQYNIPEVPADDLSTNNTRNIAEEPVNQSPEPAAVENTNINTEPEQTEAANLDAQSEPADRPIRFEPSAESAQPSDSGFEQYRSAAPTYAGIPSDNNTNTPRETVYVSNNTKKEKAPKAKLGFGAAAAIVAACVVFSGAAAFGGTVLANKLTAGTSGGAVPGTHAVGTPSIVLQSYKNDNKTAGTYVQVAEAVAPTVVEITTESIVTDSVFWGGNYVTSGAGSGVIISSDGTILTNNHVVSGASTITVRLTDGTEYSAKVLGSDPDSDIAVIKVEATGLPFVLVGDSDTLKVGEEVIAVGNPLGELGGTVTNGIISALSRDVSIDGTEMTLIQTNAAVNPGNSGGGLFNMYGELIGIVNAKSSTTSSGTSVEGIGFAIPSNTALKVANELTNYGYVRGRVMLGISYIDIDSSYKAMYYRVSALGVYIAETPYNDDLKVGDRIVAVDGEEVTYGSDVKAAIKDRAVGDKITITVVRDGRYVDVEVTLQEYIPEPAGEDSSDFEENFDADVTPAPTPSVPSIEDFFFGFGY